MKIKEFATGAGLLVIAVHFVQLPLRREMVETGVPITAKSATSFFNNLPWLSDYVGNLSTNFVSYLLAGVGAYIFYIAANEVGKRVWKVF